MYAAEALVRRNPPFNVPTPTQAPRDRVPVIQARTPQDATERILDHEIELILVVTTSSTWKNLHKVNDRRVRRAHLNKASLVTLNVSVDHRKDHVTRRGVMAPTKSQELLDLSLRQPHVQIPNLNTPMYTHVTTQSLDAAKRLRTHKALVDYFNLTHAPSLARARP